MARTDTVYNMGLRVTYPDVFEHTRGQVSPMAIGDMGDGIYFMMYNYMAITAEDMKAMVQKSQNGELREEDKLKAAEAMGCLLVVIGADSALGPKEIAEKLKMGEVSEDSFIKTGTYKDIAYYAITDRKSEDSFRKAIEPAFEDEFTALQTSLIEALKNAEYIGPQIQGAELIGKTIRFETKDIDGNPVKSEDLFSKRAVTMINIWATWCGPCKKELEELGKIHRRLEKKDAGILGICDDAGEKADECRALIAKNNLTYLNILPYEGMEELGVDAFPTSFFVDREGKILTYPVVGVPGDIAEYEKTIDSLLGKGTVTSETAPVNAETGNACRILVKDDAGNPVAGAAVQFCSDTTCTMAKTDAEGIASFTAEPGKYTVHIHKAPEGYESSGEEYDVPEDFSDVTIIVKKA